MGAIVYIFRCADGKYYVDSTRSSLEQRVAGHNAGKFDGWTARRLPVFLVWSQHFDTIRDAVAAERQIKGWRRAQKEALMAGHFHILPGLATAYSERK